MNVEFSSSVSKGGNLLKPQILTINNHFVSVRQRQSIFSTEERTIPRNIISGVEITRRLIGCNIYITTNGGMTISLENFSRDDAEEIKAIILGI